MIRAREVDRELRIRPEQPERCVKEPRAAFLLSFLSCHVMLLLQLTNSENLLFTCALRHCYCRGPVQRSQTAGLDEFWTGPDSLNGLQFKFKGRMQSQERRTG